MKFTFYYLKNQLLIIFCLLTLYSLDAQIVSYYRFSQSVETYSPLLNPTQELVSYGATGDGILDDVDVIVQLPFSFPFDGKLIDSIVVNTNGTIIFNAHATSEDIPLGVSANTTADGVLAPFGRDLRGFYNISGIPNSTINTQLIGTSPNRYFVVEWREFRPYIHTENHHLRLDFQVELHEDGKIVYRYNPTIVGTLSSVISVQVGMKGLGNNNFNIRQSSGTPTSNWLSTGEATLQSNTMMFNPNTNSAPVEGLTYTWETPLPCTTPTQQPSNLQLTRNGIIIDGTYDHIVSGNDKYLILRSELGDVINHPVDGTVYPNSNISGTIDVNLNAYVVGTVNTNSFTNHLNNSHIVGNTHYVYTIYSVNASCVGGPKYNIVNPLIDSIINCPMPMNGVSVTSVSASSITLSWPLGANGNASPLHRIIEVSTDSDFTQMVSGSPFNVSYNTLTLLVSGLNPNTQYYYRVKNVSDECESIYSSVSSIYTSCEEMTEFTESFDGIGTGSVLPNCWSKILVSGSGSSIPSINVTTTHNASAPNGVTFYGNGATMTDVNTKAILVTPRLSNVGAGTHRLKFNAKKGSAYTSNSYDIVVVALDTNVNSANIEVIDTIKNAQLSASVFREFVINFNNYSGNAKYIGLRRINGDSYTYLAVDDIVWEAIPSCPELNSVVVSNVKPTGATITFNEDFSTPAEGYEYFVSTINQIPDETSSFLATSDVTFELNTLNSNTQYFLFARRVCDINDKSPWRTTSFKTLAVTPAPWIEEFSTTSTPIGWSHAGWGISTAAGYPGNPGNNLNKNLYGTGSNASGTFSSIVVGPLTHADYELSFDYFQGAYSFPHAPLASWGNIIVQVSKDFGTTWDTLSVIVDEVGTGSYINKNFSLANYENEYVVVKITANRTAGDYWMSFDNFKIKSTSNVGCQPVFEYGAAGDMITHVVFNEIDNTSPFDSVTTPQFEDFTHISTQVGQGETHQMKIVGPASTFPSDVMAYIDFNHNGDFNDVGESFYIGRLQPANPANADTIIANITIPESAFVGSTKMRIIKNSNIVAGSDSTAMNSISGPCASDLRSGQVEEYTVVITQGNNLIQSISVTTQDPNASTTLTAENQTLQLKANLTPANPVNSNVTWSVESGNTIVSVNQSGLVTALNENGTAVVRATSVSNPTIYGEITIIVNIPANNNCSPVAEYLFDFENNTLASLFSTDCWNGNHTEAPTITVTNAAGGGGNIPLSSYGLQIYKGATVTEPIILVTPEVTTTNQTHRLSFNIEVALGGTPTAITGNEKVIIGTMSSATDFASFTPTGDEFALNEVASFTTAFFSFPAGHTFVAMKFDLGATGHKALVIDNVKWDPTASIENTYVSTIKVYPNPATTLLNIDSDEKIENVTVLDNLGRIIFHGAESTINVENFTTGVYTLVIKTVNGNTSNMKFIKK